MSNITKLDRDAVWIKDNGLLALPAPGFGACVTDGNLYMNHGCARFYGSPAVPSQTGHMSFAGVQMAAPNAVGDAPTPYRVKASVFHHDPTARSLVCIGHFENATPNVIQDRHYFMCENGVLDEVIMIEPLSDPSTETLVFGCGIGANTASEYVAGNISVQSLWYGAGQFSTSLW